MTWQEGVGIALVCIGLLGGAYAVAQRPAFWVEFGWRVFQKLRPVIWGYLSKPESDEVRKARQQCERMGGEWDHIRKRCKNR